MLVLNQHVTENSYFTFDKSLIPLSLEDDHYTDKEDGYKENRNQAPFVQFDFDDETIVNKMPLRSLNGNDTTMAPYYGQNQTTTSPDLNDNNDDELLYICRACRDYWICLPDQLKKNYRCKHRQRPIITTPQHFWSLGVPNTQTCLERGYGGVRSPTEPTERLRRPRRQFQQQEENALNNNILLDDE
ncbi:unnamed protein product [Didymodactylos carnosus]|uniref:Uncharacterized protein n=1 Tax=Didymodactylos carnosus TaxID=1234261 RepID=A0A813R7W8_9BILA|nr:unnamed protein product [Didymodactylos carnosus]CAF3560454.1 unnamed protein product [Didymodactylos carnosus]